MSEKEEPLAWGFVEAQTYGAHPPYRHSPIEVNNETDLPISLEVRIDGYRAPGFVQRLPVESGEVWIAPSAITKVRITVRIAKMSFWQKLKWLLRRRT